MLKQILSRAAGGFAYGILGSQVVQIIISLGIGYGQFMPVTSDFLALFENETTAVIVQTLLTGMIGMTFATSSFIFEYAKWSLLKQYIIHFLITSVVWIPIVSICWMPKTLASMIIFASSFLGTYVIVWFVQYVIYKKDIEKINAAILAKNEER